MPRQDRVNRKFLLNEEDQPQSQTFRAGIDFIRRNHDADDWFLQIETFDPHEPFFTQRHYQDLYPELIGSCKDGLFDWPSYAPVTESPSLVQQCRGHYAALLSMCDKRLGEVLDEMDSHQMWEDTMLIVWTDHGYLLGEHEHWAKLIPPWYQEVANTPFFVWDPRCKKAGERREALVQPSLDLGPTLLEFFGLKPSADMLGKPLADTIANDAKVRDAALFGHHGGRVNVTDGRYVYMRKAVNVDNTPLYNYTLMPCHVESMFSPSELAGAELAGPFSFTKNCPLLRVPATIEWSQQHDDQLLFDVSQDPEQRNPIDNSQTEQRMVDLMRSLMQECDSPQEQYERLGI